MAEESPIPQHPNVRLTPRGIENPISRMGPGVSYPMPTEAGGTCDQAEGSALPASFGRSLQKDRPDEFVHIDVKKVARMPDGPGYRSREPDALLKSEGSSILYARPSPSSAERQGRAYESYTCLGATV